MLDILRTFADGCAEGQIETALFGCYDGGIWGVLAIVLNVMIVLVGVLGILGIVISGIQYTTSAGDPAQMTKAKKRIVEVLIGLAAFGLMWTFLQWLIPGGVFHNSDSSTGGEGGVGIWQGVSTVEVATKGF